MDLIQNLVQFLSLDEEDRLRLDDPLLLDDDELRLERTADRDELLFDLDRLTEDDRPELLVPDRCTDELRLFDPLAPITALKSDRAVRLLNIFDRLFLEDLPLFTFRA